MLTIVQGALEAGFLYAPIAMALFLSFSILNIADMTTDGAFVLGSAVSAMFCLSGHPILAGAGIPHYAGADSFVRNGAYATCGVNYTDLGTQTADLALEVLQTGEFPEYVTVSGDIITVNTETAAALGLDYSLFESMGAQLVEVQTTQE